MLFSVQKYLIWIDFYDQLEISHIYFLFVLSLL